MRIWLKDSERRSDPSPVQTDDRTAFLVGLVLWVLGLGAVIVFLAPLTEAGQPWWLWTCVAGLAIGLIGLVYTHFRQK